LPVAGAGAYRERGAGPGIGQHVNHECVGIAGAEGLILIGRLADDVVALAVLTGW